MTVLPALRDYITGDSFEIRHCAACAFAVTHPLPNEDTIAKYYPPRYRTDRQKFTETLRTKLRARAVEKHFPKNFHGRILDLGCGSGAFALEMKRRGWDVAVTEINTDVLSHLATKGIDAQLPDHHFEKSFDAITCWHVLEHVHHPLKLAQQARSQLNPNAIFQIAVPNLASWQARTFGRHWLHLDVPRHLYHFTPATLQHLLDDSGLTISDSATVAIEYDLFGVIQSALNMICSKQNVLFEKLTGDAQNSGQASARDVIVSYALAPALTAIGLPYCILAGAFRAGGTIVTTCRVRT